ncbi:MAG: hypothetical protein HY047_11370 [Acidobacteria bacterium]|nr:hypothetical protein [Acidobacteriota bacterium]
MTLHERPGPGWAGVVIGLMIIALGVVLFLDQMGFIGWRPTWSFWPFLIIAMGLARLAQPRRDGRREGGWWVFTGVWLLLNEMRILRYRDSWPLFLVALGIYTMWKAIVRQTPPRAPKTE